MKEKSGMYVLTICILVIAVIGVFYARSGTVENKIFPEASIPHVTKASIIEGPVEPIDFEKAAAVAVPSVVHIKTITRAKQIAAEGEQQQNPFGDNFGDDFFKHFFGGDGRSFSQPEQRASGSGVIISKDGYIVTNNHVVDGATSVAVTLNNRKNFTAKVIATDANTDLAVIKIDAKNLPVMPIGNSDNVHLGQWVLAIGYPLSLDVTVTQGIVSAKSRNIGINRQGAAPVEAFIQTDAAVNPGSSGGALVNTNGELVGINAAIASPTGSYAGYAYSIPSNLMQKVIGDIMKYGRVQRGYLGIGMAPDEVDDVRKKELGINDDIKGVWVMEVDPAGAAAAAGIKKGDAIIKVNDVPVSTNSELSEQVARQKPGDKLVITFLRGNEEKTATAVLKNKLGTFASQKEAIIESLGAKLSGLNKEDAAKMGIAGGVQVTDIQDGIIANQTNMRAGFVITKVGGMAVRSVDELKDVLSKQDGNFQIEGLYPGNKTVYYYGINDFNK
jgi:Do/DeqQ family serine protease